MKTVNQIKRRIVEIDRDIITLKSQIIDSNPTVNKVLKSASISAAEKQKTLLRWVLDA